MILETERLRLRPWEDRDRAPLAAILGDPDTRFSTTPNKVKTFADFMHRAGTIKTAPEKWSDLFISQLGSRDGS